MNLTFVQKKYENEFNCNLYSLCQIDTEVCVLLKNVNNFHPKLERGILSD